ncbi:hypothetical protein Glove_108g70 [Diversispora epigaea]|uniref:CCHC-type domain-containing protein n=1 Tax=Diversispora epigaea TaxID=1348612 RepID=A0A397J350_9GLOM|nr:hypothetical protein Glove_108g70 [Diversispora epigaea]
MADWAAWKAGFVEKYCNTRWRNKWMRELENNRQRQEETVDAYYARFRRLKLTTQVNQQPNYRNRGNNRDNSSQNNWNNRNNRNNRNNNRETRTCFKCGKEGHISWDCPDRKDNSDNSAHAKLVEVEKESEKEENKLLQHLLEAYDAYLGKRERDDSSDEDTPIKRPRETNIPEPKPSLNTFGLPKATSVPVPKVVKTEITPKKKSKKKEVIKMVKGNKEKKKENATRPPLFRKKDFDIVEQLQNQPAGLSWADALEVPSIRKSFFEALRKPKEKKIKLADQEYSLKTTALKCNVAVGVYTVPTIVDSGAAISIVTRDAMEQLGYEIEEASKSIILPATGKKTQPLGVIRDLPITIQGQTIPIDVEVIDAATYSLLLGNNWLMKANASYN